MSNQPDADRVAPGLREPSSSDSRFSENGAALRSSWPGHGVGILDTLQASKLKLRQASANARKDAQRSRHLQDMTGMIHHIASMLRIELPRFRGSPAKFCAHEVSAIKPSTSNRSSLSTVYLQESDSLDFQACEFMTWVHTHDLHTASLISVLSIALQSRPQSVVDAWQSAVQDSTTKLPLIGALVFQLTGYIPFAAQVYNAEVLLHPFHAVSKRIGNLCLAIMQLSAAGCNDVCSSHHPIRPSDVFRKCAQYAAEAGLCAEQLWKTMEEGRRQPGSTDLNGIVHLCTEALSCLSKKELAKLAALLLVESDFCSASGQIDRRKFLHQVGQWIATMQAVTLPPCVAQADMMLDESGRPAPPSPRLRSLYGTSPEPAGSVTPPHPRALSPMSSASHTLSPAATWTPRRSSAKVGDTMNLGSQAAAFNAWLETVDTTAVSCFEVFRQCFAVAPRLLCHTFASVSGSHSEVPTEAIANVFERLVTHPPHQHQAAQLMMFLDVQGDKRITTDEISYCNHSPNQLCKSLDISSSGHLGHRNIMALLQKAVRGPHDRPHLAQLLVAHPALDANADGRISIEEFCTAIRRIQNRWHKAKISPHRGSWKP